MATYADISNKFALYTGDANVSSANKTLYCQSAEARVNQLILKADSRWQWDDSNYSDLPIATQALVANQQDYSFASSRLTIDRVEVKDANGQWHKLTQIDRSKLTDDSLTDYQNTAGTPKEFDLVGQSLFLYPKPSYSQSASLKVYFGRQGLFFSYSLGTFTDATGSTSSSPGFNALFHDLIPLWMAYEHAIATGRENRNALLEEISRKEAEIQEFYGLRNREERPRMTASRDSNK